MTVSQTLRIPMYRDGLALVVNAGVSSVLGVGYWAVVARVASPAVVGVSAALVASMVALANVGQLGIGGGIVSYLPRTGTGRQRLVLRCYALSAITSVLLGAVFVVVAPSVVDDLRVLRAGWVAATFVLAVVVWAAFGLQDNVLTSLRRAVWVPVENVAYSAAKLGLVLVMAGWLGGLGVFVSWTLPAALALVPVNVLIFRRLLPSTAAAGQLHAGATPFARFVTAETLGVLLWQVSTTVLPVLVVARLGARAGGLFAIPWLLTQSIDLVAANLGMSLTVEGATDHSRTQHLLRDVLRRALPLVGFVTVVGIVAAGVVLRVYGQAYAGSAATVLRVLLLACLPRAFVVLTICAARAELAVRRILVMQVSLAATVPVTAWVLMGRYGVVGAAVAWLAGQLVGTTLAMVTSP